MVFDPSKPFSTALQPPHACESCGSQVEFPGLLLCNRCQRAAALHQQAVAAGVRARGGKSLLSPKPADPLLHLLNCYESEMLDRYEGTHKLEVKLQPGKWAREVLGLTCEDEGCPHFGTRHSHGKAEQPSKQLPVIRLPVSWDANGCLSDADGATILAVEPGPFPETLQAVANLLNQQGPGGVYISKEGRAFGSVSDEQIEVVLQMALADVRKRSSLQHKDEIAVEKFADAMKMKMALSRMKGRSGWDDPAQCTARFLQAELANHLPKGDPVDVANFCMMLWSRGERAVAAPEPWGSFADRLNRQCSRCGRDTANGSVCAFGHDDCKHFTSQEPAK